MTSEDLITIKLTISNGIAVPDLEGEKVDNAEQELKDLGFKKIKKEAAKKASDSSEEYRVYRVAYEDPETGDWAEISGDGRLSAKDTIILYYYDPVETTQEPTTARRPETSTTEKETQADETEGNQSQDSGNDAPLDDESAE